MLREALAPAAAAELRELLPPTLRACQLAWTGEEGAFLRTLPLVEGGEVVKRPLVPTGTLGQASAAWDSAHTCRTLVWVRGCR